MHVECCPLSRILGGIVSFSDGFVPIFYSIVQKLKGFVPFSRGFVQLDIFYQITFQKIVYLVGIV